MTQFRFCWPWLCLGLLLIAPAAAQSPAPFPPRVSTQAPVAQGPNVRTAPRLPSQSSSSSSNRSTRVSGRSVRGIVRLVAIVVIVVIGIGGWLVKRMSAQ